jgi:hypothetical protein
MDHLTDEQLATWLASEASPQAESHLAICAQCRAECEQLRFDIRRYSLAMRRHASDSQDMHLTLRPASLRDALRNASQSKSQNGLQIESRHGLRHASRDESRHGLPITPRWATAAVLALLLIVPTAWTGIKLLHPPTVAVRTVAAPRANPLPTAAMSDDELLQAVNSDLSREVPQALAPVSAITVARNSLAAASTTFHSTGDPK